MDLVLRWSHGLSFKPLPASALGSMFGSHLRGAFRLSRTPFMFIALGPEPSLLGLYIHLSWPFCVRNLVSYFGRVMLWLPLVF